MKHKWLALKIAHLDELTSHGQVHHSIYVHSYPQTTMVSYLFIYFFKKNFLLYFHLLFITSRIICYIWIRLNEFWRKKLNKSNYRKKIQFFLMTSRSNLFGFHYVNEEREQKKYGNSNGVVCIMSGGEFEIGDLWQVDWRKLHKKQITKKRRWLTCVRKETITKLFDFVSQLFPWIRFDFDNCIFVFRKKLSDNSNGSWIWLKSNLKKSFTVVELLILSEPILLHSKLESS